MKTVNFQFLLNWVWVRHLAGIRIPYSSSLISFFFIWKAVVLLLAWGSEGGVLGQLELIMESRIGT